MFLCLFFSSSCFAVSLIVDYQHEKTQENMLREKLKEQPNNATLWHALGMALEGQQQYLLAKEAYQKAVTLGYSRNWKSQVSLVFFHDSNVALSPSILDLPAQDTADIGAVFHAQLDVNVVQQSWGHSALHIYVQHMQYQSNNTLALANIGLELQQYVHAEANYTLLAAVGIQQQRLNQTMLFNQLDFKLNGSYQVNDAWTFVLKHQFSQRNYNTIYQKFSGTLWHIQPTIEGHYEHIHAEISLGSGGRHTRVAEERYDFTTFYAQIAYHVWQTENQTKNIVVWAKVKSEGRVYQVIDRRAGIRKPKIRQDTETLYILGIDFRKSHSVFGDTTSEIWRLKGSSHFNLSNMNKRAYVNPRLSKNWKRWWVAFEFLWNY